MKLSHLLPVFPTLPSQWFLAPAKTLRVSTTAQHDANRTIIIGQSTKYNTGMTRIPKLASDIKTIDMVKMTKDGKEVK
jgi:hypothetical protein